MRLAEALNLRADTAKRISELSVRLNANAKVQDGDKPSEDPCELLNELDRLTEQLEKLISQINLTNSRVVCNGKTLTEMIAKKDVLSLKSSVIRSFLGAASDRVERYSKNEIKILSSVDVAALRKQADSLSEEIRLLNVRIQELNWTNDLIEE